jgi:type I restriction enzyme M protein
MFFTVTLPVTWWFLDKGKKGASRADEVVLFIDARHIFHQVTRAHRDFTPEQNELLGNIVRLWRGEKKKLTAGSGLEMTRLFGDDGGYRDISWPLQSRHPCQDRLGGLEPQPRSLCRRCTGRAGGRRGFPRAAGGLAGGVEGLNTKAARLQDVIAQNVAEVLA